ncbi:MAG TPA: hypothetical protein DEP51_02450 [Clostridiales bacterium]|nr:hypothetical protein [Clostridiales bacterium]
MGWLSDFYYGNSEEETFTDYGQKGFAYPSGRFEPFHSGKVHPDRAKEIVENNQLYSKVFERLPKEFQDFGYYYFLIALGFIATDNEQAAFSAVIPKKSIMKNKAQKDIEDYNKRKGRKVEYGDCSDNYYKALESIWNELTKGKTVQNGR